MTIKTRLTLLLICIVSLAAVGAWAQAQKPAHEPEVLAGSDIGFRVDHFRGDTPVGELVVKKDGKWVPIEFSARMKMAK